MLRKAVDRAQGRQDRGMLEHSPPMNLAGESPWKNTPDQASKGSGDGGGRPLVLAQGAAVRTRLAQEEALTRNTVHS